MNFSYTSNPGYVDLIHDFYSIVKWYSMNASWANYSFPKDFVTDFKRYYYFPLGESYPIFLIAILFTIIRYGFETVVCKRLIRRLNIDNPYDRFKFPESSWKFLVCSFLWGYNAYLLIFSGKYDYFYEPSSIWDDWKVGMEIPADIQWMYFIQCGFYFHSIYATLFMDTWRKDLFVMIIHHILTLVLIIVSFATRYHKIGLLVLFVHDVTDILLEFTKCHVYLRRRNGKFYKYHEYISNIGFVAFAFTWYLFRLYWFPLKVLYASGVYSAHKAFYLGAGLYPFFNGLLWFLLILDLYWFYYILLFLYKVATGQLKELNDTREYDKDQMKEKMMAANRERVKAKIKEKFSSKKKDTKKSK